MTSLTASQVFYFLIAAQPSHSLSCQFSRKGKIINSKTKARLVPRYHKVCVLYFNGSGSGNCTLNGFHTVCFSLTVEAEWEIK